jgi:hypothetical protein
VAVAQLWEYKLKMRRFLPLVGMTAIVVKGGGKGSAENQQRNCTAFTTLLIN